MKDDKKQSSEQKRTMWTWNIKDPDKPKPTVGDPYNEWVDGDDKRVFIPADDDKCIRLHKSGWAMRSTNNHDPNVLKKSCIGVIVCSAGCHLRRNKPVFIKAMISDKTRKVQIDASCTNTECNGKQIRQPCTGNAGYPVTHSWIKEGPFTYFEAKGRHDHERPNLKPVRRMKRKNDNTTSGSSAESSGTTVAVTAGMSGFNNKKYFDGPGFTDHSTTTCLPCTGRFVTQVPVPSQAQPAKRKYLHPKPQSVDGTGFTHHSTTAWLPSTGHFIPHVSDASHSQIAWTIYERTKRELMTNHFYKTMMRLQAIMESQVKLRNVMRNSVRASDK